MRSALLRGREHQDLGAVDTIAEGPAAIAISLGGRRKVYAHTDPNEDAALFAWSDEATLLAVADGHGGFEAAEVALEHLAEHPAPQWLNGGLPRPASWERQVLAVLYDVNERILREVGDGEREGSETTLALALLAPRTGLLLHAAVGDSHVFVVGPEAAEDVALGGSGEPGRHFLGRQTETPGTLLSRCAIGVRKLADLRAVVLATDGLSEHGIGVADPAAVVRGVVERSRSVAAELRAREIARGVVEAALDSHRRRASGDNTSAAVTWLEGDPPR